MSRRAPNPAAERASQNAQTIKNLLKLEGNKTCADCKRNKHPRWASWNLGIFICIRCSGIHRGMGTHISRVKSVDLDAWTDEQLQSVLKWGNSRANKYWESKLAAGHVPSESKIENFIRTKYESKRWVIEGPIPDPSTLEAEADEDVPLSIVKEKQAIERSASQKAKATPQPGGLSQVGKAQQPDLFGDDIRTSPRVSTAAPITSRSPPKAEAAPPKQMKPVDSLLGLDFFGTETAPLNRPLTATPNPGFQSRPDLKQSILSLYATAPRAQRQQPPPPPHNSQGSLGGMQSPTRPSNSLGGMDDAFSGLNFSGPKSTPMQTKPKQSAVSHLGNIPDHQKYPSQATSILTGGGSFFDTLPTQKPVQKVSQGLGTSGDFGAFNSSPGLSPAVNSVSASSGLGDLFDFSKSAPHATAPKQTIASPPAQQNSVFHLSQPAPPSEVQSLPGSTSTWSSNDAWASSDAWGNTVTASPSRNLPAPAQTSTGDFGWGSTSGNLASQSIVPGGEGGFATASNAQPKVSADEDFGGWSTAAAPTGTTSTKPVTGFAGSEDLFSNVWG